MMKRAIVTLIGLSLCGANVSVAQINAKWIGSSQGKWETAANWNPPIVPENGADTFDVTIDGSSIELTSDHTIDSLNTFGAVGLKRWTLKPVVLTVLNDFTNHGDLETPNTTHLYVHGDMINSDRAKIDILSEELRVYGATGLYNLGRIYIDPDAELKSEVSDINNVGILELNGGAVSADQVFTNGPGAIIKGSGMIAGRHVLNAGLIESTAGTLQVFGKSVSNAGTLKNIPGSSVKVTSDSLSQNKGLITAMSEGAVVFDCSLTNEPNGIIELMGGTIAATTIVQKANAAFEGFGCITADIQIEPNAAVELTGPAQIVGDIDIAADAALYIDQGQVLVTGATICKGSIRIREGSLTLQGGGDCSKCSIVYETAADYNYFDTNLDNVVDFNDLAKFAENWLWTGN